MNKTNNRYIIAGVAALALAGLCGPSWAASTKYFYPEDLPAAGVNEPVKYGEWHLGWEVCKDFADKNNAPMIAIWGNHGCIHCYALECALTNSAFKAWQQTHNEGKVVMCFMAGGEAGYPDQQWSAGYNYLRDGAARSWPMVLMYWPAKNLKKFWYGDAFRDNLSYYKVEESIPAIINKFETYFAGWVPPADYSGGTFVTDYTEGNRLEAEDGTGEISFEMVRSEIAAKTATNNLVKVVSPDGNKVGEITLSWAKGQTNQTVTVDISNVAFSKDGDTALLIAADVNGNEQATNTVTYVTGSGESSSNPLWIGERKAMADNPGEKPVLEFGEWTMDIDVAKAKVAAAAGDAYTLVSVQGALWCPDCANTERNFVDVKDKNGVNRLSAWAKENQVAFVAVDVPSFATNNIDNISRPTLLSRKAISTTLARGREYPASGAEASLTNAMVRSGLGYLTRKGVSDEVAAEYLERNRQLVTTDFSNRGFHSAADSSPFRTGVPIYVILDKEGNVKARLTRFASVSPMKDVVWDDVIKRFDEMLAIAKDGSAHADGGVMEDDYPSDDCRGIAASGGNVSGEISHCDFRDTYKLENFDGNAFLLATANGKDAAEVTLSFVKLGADGKKVTIASQTGALKDVVALSASIEESGEFFIEVSGSSYDAEAFSVSNPAEQAFHSYEIDCAVVLIPGETRSRAVAPEGTSTVSMLIEADTLYRIEGLAENHGAALQKVADNFYVSTLEEGPSYEDMTTLTAGGTVVYQRWVPGSVGFTSQKKTVTESVGDVTVEFARDSGTSGEVKVRVSLDEDATTLYDSDGAARFEFTPVEFTWAEGESGKTNTVVSVRDDARFDGAGVVVLKLELLSDENGDTELTTTNFFLTVNEDDKQSAGKAAFTDADPFFSRKGTVYARESEGATVYVERVEASDGYVTVTVNATNGAKTEIGGVETNVVVWANHKFDKQAVKVTGIAAGKSAKLTLANPTDGLKVLSASNSVTVVAVADDAPAFAQDADARPIYRYVATSNVYPVVLADDVDASSVKLTFTKLSGTLPAGLSAKYDPEAKGLAIFGTPTAKAGVYTMVYQVTQKVGSKTTPGLTVELTYTIQDPTAAGGGGSVCNEAVAAVKSRTFKDIPAVDVVSKRLAGILQVTIPQTGRASAKLVCFDGTVSFSAKGWSGFDYGGYRTLMAELTSTRKGYSMTLEANADGSVVAAISTPYTAGGDPLSATCGGGIWSKANSAANWQGYYTVVLMNGGVTEAEGAAGVAPRGHGCLTLKMNTASAVNSGTVTYAGMLPNGTSISGSAVLCRDGECEGIVGMPVYKKSSADVVSAVLELCDSGIVRSSGDVDAGWKHMEKYEETSYDVALNPYGNLYSATTNLAVVSMEGYETTTPTLTFDGSGLSGWMYAGVPVAMDGVAVTVNEKTLSVAKGNAVGATLSFNRSTGIVSGSFKLPYTTEAGVSKTMSASYKGVVLIGYGPGCGCDEQGLPTTLPFVTGAFYVSDKMSVSVGSGTRVVTVKRGGTMTVE